MITILTIAVIALIVERVVSYAKEWKARRELKKWSENTLANFRIGMENRLQEEDLSEELIAKIGKHISSITEQTTEG